MKKHIGTTTDPVTLHASQRSVLMGEVIVTCNLQPSTLQPATCNLQPYNLQPATCNLVPLTRQGKSNCNE